MSEQTDRDPEAPLTRRGLLKSAAFAAALATPALSALAEAATKPKRKPAPKAEAIPMPLKAGPDFSVCQTPAERTALERQWKQMVDTVDTLKKTPLPVGSEFATRALAPRRLRRGEA